MTSAESSVVFAPERTHSGIFHEHVDLIPCSWFVHYVKSVPYIRRFAEKERELALMGGYQSDEYARRQSNLSTESSCKSMKLTLLMVGESLLDLFERSIL